MATKENAVAKIESIPEGGFLRTGAGNVKVRRGADENAGEYRYFNGTTGVDGETKTIEEIAKKIARYENRQFDALKVVGPEDFVTDAEEVDANDAKTRERVKPPKTTSKKRSNGSNAKPERDNTIEIRENGLPPATSINPKGFIKIATNKGVMGKWMAADTRKTVLAILERVATTIEARTEKEVELLVDSAKRAIEKTDDSTGSGKHFIAAMERIVQKLEYLAPAMVEKQRQIVRDEKKAKEDAKAKK